MLDYTHSPSSLCHMSKGAREEKFYDRVSKVTITDQFTKEYMDIFMKYPITATLIDKQL